MTTKMTALFCLLSFGVVALAQAGEPAPAPMEKKDEKKGEKKDEKGGDKPVEKKDDSKGGAPVGDKK
jgi:ribosomal protein L12E/L44/L45/RPP1/RPP2